MDDITIILPAKNEAENLQVILKDIIKYIIKSKNFNKVETIVVNDFSNDNTINVVNKFFKEIENLILINLNKNIGKAYSIDIALDYSSGDTIIVMDADLQYETEDILLLYNEMNNKIDMVNGKRGVRKDSALINSFSNLYYFFLSKFFSINKYDYFSGIKIFKKSIYKKMEYRGLIRFLIFYCLKNNLNVIEKKITHKKRKYGKSTYSFFSRLKLTFADIFTLITCVYFGSSINKFIKYVYYVFNVLLITLMIYFYIKGMIILHFLIFISGIIIWMFIILKLVFKQFFNYKKKNTMFYKDRIKSIIKNST